MKYIKFLMILCCCAFAFEACDDDVKVGQESNNLTAGFTDTVLTVYENASPVEIGVMLSAPAPEDLTLHIAVQNEENVQENKDYVLQTKTLLIPKGRNAATIVLDLIDDKVENQFRSLELILVGGTGLTVRPETNRCKINVLDDESDCSVVFKEAEFALREDDTEGIIVPLQLEGHQTDAVLVSVAVKPVTFVNQAIEHRHFEIENKEIRVDKGASVQNLGVKIIPVNDEDINPARMFVLEITKVVGATKITEKSTCVVTIKNDDLGLLWGKTEVTVEENPDGNAVVEIPVKLLGDAGGELRLSVGANAEGMVEGQDFVIENKELVIREGEDSVMVRIMPVYNPEITSDKILQLQITSVEGKEELAGASCAVTIQNYDADLTVGAENYYIGAHADRIAMPVKLSQPLHHDVEVKFQGKNTGGGEDLTLATETLKIRAGQTDTIFVLNILPGDVGNRFEIAAIPLDGLTDEHNMARCGLSVFNVGTIDSKADWSIDSFTSEEDKNDGPATAVKLIDGKDETFWHSVWSGGREDQGPFDIVIDLKKLTGVSNVRCVRRSGNTDAKRVSFHLSDGTDKKVWSKLGEATYGATGGGEVSVAVKQYYPAGRYLKVRVEECRGNTVASLAEVYLQGFQVP